MKRSVIKRVVSYLIMITLMAGFGAPINVYAAQPDGYWPYFSAYNDAVTSGNVDEILRTGDALLNFYTSFSRNQAIAEMSFNIFNYRFSNMIFEKRGDYAAARANAEKLIEFAQYLGFDDSIIAARARISKLEPLTEVYTLSDTGVYYGAKHEPVSGTYYGRPERPEGEESAVSFYVELGEETAGAHAWRIDEFDDGTRLLQIKLNYPHEGRTALEINEGIHDANISETLQYLSTLSSPTLLRIGGEMNLWDEMSPETFKASYIRIADMARSMAPNLALVWAPNYVGSWGSDLADYYPGDNYVDWVGLSLYMSTWTVDPGTEFSPHNIFFGHGLFADAVLSAKEVVEFAGKHRKPVIVTESGAVIRNIATGAVYEEQAAEQYFNIFAVLNMVYPSIKAIFQFDTHVDTSIYDYEMSRSAVVTAAFQRAVDSNPTLIRRGENRAPSFVKLSGHNGPTTNAIELFAYGDTLYGDSMSVSYTLNQQPLSSQASLPFRAVVDNQGLAAGAHELKATFNDGAGFTNTRTFTLTSHADNSFSFTSGFTGDSAPAPAPAPQNEPSNWAREEVSLAISNGLVPDRMQTGFTNNISRVDFCELIVNLVETKLGDNIDNILAERGAALDASLFTDTSDRSVLAAAALGIVGGRGNGIFDPSAGISREEAARMLSNAAELMGITSSGSPAAFADEGQFSSWAVDAIKFVSSVNDQSSGNVVMGGVDGGAFDPKGSYTYQQAFITMLRLFRS